MLTLHTIAKGGLKSVLFGIQVSNSLVLINFLILIKLILILYKNDFYLNYDLNLYFLTLIIQKLFLHYLLIKYQYHYLGSILDTFAIYLIHRANFLMQATYMLVLIYWTNISI